MTEVVTGVIALLLGAVALLACGLSVVAALRSPLAGAALLGAGLSLLARTLLGPLAQVFFANDDLLRWSADQLQAFWYAYAALSTALDVALFALLLLALFAGRPAPDPGAE